MASGRNPSVGVPSGGEWIVARPVVGGNSVRRSAHGAIPEWYHRSMALTVRTDEQMEEALDALVELEGVSRQEVIRRSIVDRYERSVHRRRVAEGTERLAARWGDVLERLGRE